MSGFDLDLGLQVEGFGLTWSLECDCDWAGLFGASGLGKTTALELLLGWRGDGAGEVRRPDLELGVGYAAQDLLLFPHWTVAQNLEAGRRGALPGGLTEGQLLEALGLEELMERRADRLSGGEGRRVALARAILSAPDRGLLILDEPLVSLDAERRVLVVGFLLALKAARSGPVLVVSHSASDLACLVDWVQRIEQVPGGSSIRGGGVPETELADEALFENRWLAEVLEVQGDVAVCSLGHELQVVVPSRWLHAGERVLLGLGSDDVLLGLDDPGRVSARNKLAGHVSNLERAGAYVSLRVQLAGDAPDFVTHLTDGAVGELELSEGAAVHLFFKTRSVALLARLPKGDV